MVAQAIGLVLFGFWAGAPASHALFEGAAVAAFAAAALWPGLSRRVQSALASTGLISASAVLVHLSGGYIEAHFHFFVMLGVISLYEDWTPYLVAVAYVALHHGIVGTFDPRSVYNHPAAFANPWLWAGIHAIFIAALSVANVVAWKTNERSRVEAASAQLDARKQVERSEKMAAMGSLVSGVAHEIRTPLTYVQTHLYLLDRRLEGNADARASVAAALEGVDRVNRIVATLRKYTRVDLGERRVGDLAAAVNEAVQVIRVTRREVQLDVRHLPAPTILFSPQQIHQVVLNLVENAADAAPGKLVRIETRGAHDGGVELIIQDSGPGIPKNVQPLLFQPLVTTKAHGTGLGLSIVKRIVDEHEGHVDVETHDGLGTTFTLWFPPAAEPPATASRPPDSSASPIA